jgi:hypothetical protein
MRKIALALGIVLLLAAGQSFAQRNEISGFGTWNSLSGSGGTRDHDWDMNYLQLSYGYYFSQNLVGTLGWQRLSKMGDKNFDIADVGAKYYFGTFKQGAFLPFVEGGIGLYDFNGTDLGWRVGVGGSWMITESTSIDPTFNYLSTASGDKLNGHILGLRITVRF